MTTGCPTRSGRTMARSTVATLCALALLALAIGCPKRKGPDKSAVTGDPLADLPVVLGRGALLLQEESRGIGTLFNNTLFAERKRDAERIKAQHQVEIDKLQEEIKERFAYIEAIEALKNNIEADCARLPLYFELTTQVSRATPTGEELWKVAAVWLALETRAEQYRQFLDDMTTGQMARKYLGLSERVQKEAENRTQPSLSRIYNDFSGISAGYGRETSVSKLEEHMTTLNKGSETLTWVGSEHFDKHHAIREKRVAEGVDLSETAAKGDEMYSKTFDETVRDIRILADDVRSHISVCKVYHGCNEKFDRLMQNGLQAQDVDSIEALKRQLADKEPQAPNEDSANVLKYGRDEMDRLVEVEVQKMRRARDGLESLCKRAPDLTRPENYLSQLRKGREEIRTIRTVFYALNLFDDAEKAEEVKQLAEKRERCFDKLLEMYKAQQEMQGYTRELQQMPRYGTRTSAQRKKADQMRKKLKEYRTRFMRYRSDSDLADHAEQCLTVIDQLMPQVGE